MKAAYSFGIFLLAICFGLALNEANLFLIKKANPDNHPVNTKSTAYGNTVWSIDNEWYVTQIKHLVNGEGYTLDPAEPEMKVRRTPMYPLFYGIHYLLFGEENSYLIIRYTQLILFALSSVLLAWIVINFTGNIKWGIVSGILYAVSPFIVSYTYFTITEGLSPALVIFYLYFFSVYYRSNKLHYLFFCGLMFGLAFLTRPLTGILLPGLIGAIFFKNPEDAVVTKVKRTTYHAALMGGGFLLMIAPWIIRNYQITDGELIIAEKYYHGAPMIFGKAHVELRYLTSTWTNPSNLSAETLSIQLMNSIQNGNREQGEIHIANYLARWPDRAFQGYSREELAHALELLYTCYVAKEKYLNNKPDATRSEILNLPCEAETYEKFRQFRQDFIASSPLQYYVVTPFNTMKDLIFQSNSSNIGSLNPSSQSYSIAHTLLKGIMYLLNVSLFASWLVFVIFYQKDMALKVLISLSVVLLFLALTVFLFRYVESRYLLPVFPLLYITLGYVILLVRPSWEAFTHSLNKKKSPKNREAVNR